MESINIIVYSIRNSEFSSNTYIIANKESRQSVLIDPGMDVKVIDAVLEEHSLNPRNILVTHGHFDHVGSVAFFQKKFNARFHIHQLDIKVLRSVNFFLKIMKIESKIEVPVPDNILSGEFQKIYLEDFCFEVYNLPGHTDGSCVFKCGENLFTGDTFYSKGIGINYFPGYNEDKLRSSIRKIKEWFDPALNVYPGHGASEKLGIIWETNMELNQFMEPNKI